MGLAALLLSITLSTSSVKEAEALAKQRRFVEAAAIYKEYLREHPNAPDRASVQDRIAELDARARAGGDELSAVPLLPAAPETPSAPPLLILPPPAPARVEAQTSGRSHVAAYALGGGAVVAAAVAITGAIEVASYNSYLSSAQQHPGTQMWDPGRPGAAAAWDVVAVVAAVLSAAGVAGAVIAW